MTASERDPVEDIVRALSRLRGKWPSRGVDSSGGRPRSRLQSLHKSLYDGFVAHHESAREFLASPRGMDGSAQMRMLEALAAAQASLSVSELGTVIGVDQPRASRLVQQGVERGLVRREADPRDARRTRIALTAEGRRIARGVRGERREALAQALTTFSDAERAELARLLSKLADNWDR